MRMTRCSTVAGVSLVLSVFTSVFAASPLATVTHVYHSVELARRVPHSRLFPSSVTAHFGDARCNIDGEWNSGLAVGRAGGAGEHTNTRKRKEQRRYEGDTRHSSRARRDGDVCIAGAGGDQHHASHDTKW